MNSRKPWLYLRVVNEPTKRSRKSLRTPSKNNKDKLDNLTAMMEGIMLKVQKIRNN